MIYDKNQVINSLFNKTSLRVLLYYIKVKIFHIFKKIIYNIFIYLLFIILLFTNLYLCLFVI